MCDSTGNRIFFVGERDGREGTLSTVYSMDCRQAGRIALKRRRLAQSACGDTGTSLNMTNARRFVNIDLPLGNHAKEWYLYSTASQ
jgi:hypothetical protein